MKTEVMIITDDLQGKDDILKAADKFSQYNDIKDKSALHIRLLTEEAVSMVNGIMENFKAKLWLESEKTDKGLLCRICVTAEKAVNSKQEEQILSVATTGENESARGILGKIREMFRLSVQQSTEGVYQGTDPRADGWYSMGMCSGGMQSGAAMAASMWSLTAYRSNLPADSANENWDELEKSIIAKVADDVKVWLKSESTEIVIEKLI